MGEEVKKVEEEPKVDDQKKEEAPAAPELEKKEEAPAAPELDKKEEAPAAVAAPAEGEEKKEEEAASKEPPPPPPPVILGINLHCKGCVNKIKRCILRCKGNLPFPFFYILGAGKLTRLIN
uniref:HMA domain-containing protein n=1 Tax=Arundo donax TaxID=35708 RepID=A0A0A9AEZ0_ARUDO